MYLVRRLLQGAQKPETSGKHPQNGCILMKRWARGKNEEKKGKGNEEREGKEGGGGGPEEEAEETSQDER